jgi:elongation factor P
MAVLSHVDLRKGVKVDIDNHPYVIIDSDFVKPGKGQAFTRMRIRSYLTGNTIERTIKSNEKIPKADIEEKSCQFLYSDGSYWHFMDMSSYEQIQITGEVLGTSTKWMQENMECSVLVWKGNPLSAEPPNFVELEITQCDPGVKGDTAQGGSKPATLSTGAVVNVPLFVNEGEWIKIDTRTGDYVERVKR